MTFDPSKPVQTTVGEPARILCTDRKDVCGRSIVALVTSRGVESTRTFMADGKSASGHYSDLINVPERHVRWVNVYRRGPIEELSAYSTRKYADGFSGRERIACIRVEFTDGEGL